jgi:hypothetical protein
VRSRASSPAAGSYVALLRDHIAKGERRAVPDGRPDARDQADLLRAFETMEHQDMGVGTHEQFLRLARDLCATLGIEWAAHSDDCARLLRRSRDLRREEAPASSTQVGALPGSR